MKFFEFADRNNELCFSVAMLICIAAVTMSVSSCVKHNTRVYAANGYEQVQKQGTTETMWVKKR